MKKKVEKPSFAIVIVNSTLFRNFDLDSRMVRAEERAKKENEENWRRGGRGR